MSNKFEQFHCKKCKSDLPFNHLVLVDPNGIRDEDSQWVLGCINCFTTQKQYKLNEDFYVVNDTWKFILKK